jgi:hypothetical protein
MLPIDTCTVCGDEIARAPNGRPRLYCSNACRQKAKRARQAERRCGSLRPSLEPQDIGGLTVSDLLGPKLHDPDEAVAESIVLARSAAAAFGVSAERARPQLAWRCEAMSQHIASGLRKYFTPR